MARPLRQALRSGVTDVLHDLVEQQLPQLGEVGAEGRILSSWTRL
jgi:hypothetical protein